MQVELQVENYLRKHKKVLKQIWNIFLILRKKVEPENSLLRCALWWKGQCFLSIESEMVA